jgi:type IX secretion system PorP/SprF family membrane protein
MKTLFNKMQYLLRMNNCAKWIVGLILLASTTVNAQQEPTYTQYMFNTQTVNPAYAGTWESMGFMVLAREQWVGFDDAPSTQTFTFQTLMKNKKVGLGLNVINDKFGLEKRFSLFGDYSYLVKMDDELKLRLGLKMGFSSYSNNLSNYDIVDPNDPFFQGEIDQKFMPNFGIGAFLYKDRYYVGLSVPKMVQNDFKHNYNNYSSQAEMRHYYLIGGYVFNLSENLQFKPTMLTKYTPNIPVQVDLSANFLIANRFWLGTMYRSGDSFGFIAQWIINNKLRFGYAVDFSTTKLQNYNDGTHEIMVSYELKSLKEMFVSPRYF